MIADMLRMLHPFDELNKYRYIGFGALEFIDFKVFHRNLDISEMVSIESKAQDKEQKKRFEFNKPYKSINLVAGPSHSKLSDVDLGQKSIVWLDYTSQLKFSILQDMNSISEKLPHGSVIMITLNCDPEGISNFEGSVEKKIDKRGNKEEERIKKSIGNRRMPRFSEKDEFDGWGGWGKSHAYRLVLNQQFARLLEKNDRNINARQIFYFQYRSGFGSGGSRMMTVGWLLGDGGPITARVTDTFDQFSFYQPGTEPFRIQIPVLTPKEKSYYRERIPDTGGRLPDWADRSDFESFKEIYKYHSTFVATEEV